MKIALVHDWLTEIGGDVRVLKALHELYPDAPIYCLTRNKQFTNAFFPNAKIHSSFVIHHSSFLLPFFPSTIESIDLSAYDVVISTGSIFSKGLILRPKTYHVNYCHSPTRQVWDLSHESRNTLHKPFFQHFLRIWDRQASTRVDQFVANSENVRARIKKYYRRDSVVIYPPVSPPTHNPSRPPLTLRGGAIPSPLKQGGLRGLIVSRLYRHKNIDIAIKAFNKLGWNLVIIGEGPERDYLQDLAGPTVRLLGSFSDELCALHFSLCAAFILPQEEDFGIAPIEAMMHGKPVLALRRGGALEYIQEGINGLFFDDPHEAVLADGVRRIREITFNAEAIKQSVAKFSWQRFRSSFSSLINQITH